MPTLVLVDGSSYLYRAFHALPDLRTSQGEPTGALRGVLAMLRRMVEDGKPDYFAVVFDAPGKTFRDDWYPEYKANRPPMPDDLVRQLAPLQELVRANGWPLLVVDGVEADDVIGTLAKAAQRAGIDTLISTSDKDLAQLVEPGVTCVNTMSNETLDPEGVVAKFGVRPDQVLDLLALTGDAVDNVPGVPKVGPKTAAKWLAQYGSLDNIVAHAADIGGVVGENLRAALDWLPKGRRLLTVKTDCELPVGASRPRDLCRWTGRSSRSSTGASSSRAGCATSPPALRPRRPLPTRSPRRPRATTPAVVSISRCTPAARASPPTCAYEAVLTQEALERWIADLDAAALACFDTETTSLDPMGNEIVGLSFCVEPGRACYVPLAHRYAGAPDQLDRAAVLARLAPWFASTRHAKVGQNVKFDQHALANHGIALAGVAHDTLLESYVLESHKPHDMDSLAWRHLDWKTIAYAEVCGKGASQIGFDQVSVEHATEYSAEDADVTLRLHRHLHPQLAADAKLERLYREIEMPVREVLFHMERHGVLVDAALLARQGGELAGRILALEHQAHRARRAAVQPGLAEAAGRDPVHAHEAAGDEEDRHGAAVDRRGSPAGARGGLPAAEGAARAPRAVEAEEHLYRQAAADDRPAHRPRAHDVRAGDRRHRAARVERPEPAEHPGAHRGGPAHPRGVRRARGPRDRVRRLLADRAAHHGAPLRRPGADARLPRGCGHPPRDRRARSSACRPPT